jgi:hypothetical protein
MLLHVSQPGHWRSFLLLLVDSMFLPIIVDSKSELPTKKPELGSIMTYFLESRSVDFLDACRKNTPGTAAQPFENFATGTWLTVENS